MPPFVPLWKETRGFPSSWFVYREVIAAAERGHAKKKNYIYLKCLQASLLRPNTRVNVTSRCLSWMPKLM